VHPIALPANQFERFYRGGARIAALRGEAPRGERMPEDWVASTTTSFGQEREGLSVLPGGPPLRDAIAAAPEAFLGPAHVARFGADPAVLVKLLDAGERLPVHSHPGRDFARRHLGPAFGKTEAWLVIEAEPGATMALGLRADLPADELARWAVEQDTDAMLAALHTVPVAAGDALFVPAGTLHAIGAGVLVVELQEPTDLSVLLEWRRFGLNTGDAHLGLGWPTALASVDRSAVDPDAFRARPREQRPGVRALLPAAADPFFRAEELRPGGGTVELEPAFAVLVVVEGGGALATEGGDGVALARGMTVLVPFAAGATQVTGDLRALRCLPPLPGSISPTEPPAALAGADG
jgi:mannose-6-phosphate isomerase